MLVVRVSGRLSNYYIFGIYRSANADDCLIAKLEAVQQSDSRATFVLTGGFNPHNKVWGSPSTSSSGQAALDFVSSPGCTQLVAEPTHKSGGVLDLVFTDVRDIVNVTLCDKFGNSDRHALKLGITVTQIVQLVVSDRMVYLKNRVD